MQKAVIDRIEKKNKNGLLPIAKLPSGAKESMWVAIDSDGQHAALLLFYRQLFF